MGSVAFDPKPSELAVLCRRFGVRRLDLFGSAATGAFDPGSSDVDMLVEFDDEPTRLFDRYFGLKESLHDELFEILNASEADAKNRGDAPINVSEVGEQQVSEALDKLEKQHGFTLTGPVRELVNTRIVNVLSKSLGVVAKDSRGRELVVYILPRNGEVPMERVSDFGTDTPDQTAVEIRVMAGERANPNPLDCQEVGVAILNLPEDLPENSPIRVKFAITRDGRLNVSATDMTGGGSIDVEFQTEAVLSASEVEDRSTALRMMTVS